MKAASDSVFKLSGSFKKPGAPQDDRFEPLLQPVSAYSPSLCCSNQCVVSTGTLQEYICIGCVHDTKTYLLLSTLYLDYRHLLHVIMAAKKGSAA